MTYEITKTILFKKLPEKIEFKMSKILTDKINIF